MKPAASPETLFNIVRDIPQRFWGDIFCSSDTVTPKASIRCAALNHRPYLSYRRFGIWLPGILAGIIFVISEWTE